MSSMSATSPSARRVYRRPTMVESAATVIGAALVRWAERRRTIRTEWAENERAAVLRREQLHVLRSDVMGAAHSGLYIWR